MTNFTHQQRFLGKYISNIGALRFNFFYKDFFSLYKPFIATTLKEPGHKTKDKIFMKFFRASVQQLLSMTLTFIANDLKISVMIDEFCDDYRL